MNPVCPVSGVDMCFEFLYGFHREVLKLMDALRHKELTSRVPEKSEKRYEVAQYV